MSMTLLFREMFAQTGTLTSGAPGSNFSSVSGTLYQRPGGPRLSAGVAASFDPQVSGQATGYTSYGASTSTSGQTKLFIGQWVFIKSIATQGANASPVLTFRSGATSGNTTICMAAIAGRIDTYHTFGGGGVNLGSLPVTSGWVYLAIAISRVSGTTWDGRMYYKVPGGALTQFVSWSSINSFFSSWGSAVFGCVANNPSINGRYGACSVYSFANADFSDIAYPSDVIEPLTGLTWYVNPSTGNDASDGISAASAWRTAGKINTESANSGFLAATSYAAGDTLVIDTSGASLDLTSVALTFQTRGLNVRAASGQTWATCVPYKTLAPGDWSTSGTTNVYQTSNTVALACLWEDDKWLNHPTGANFAAVSASLSSTPGSFWTNGTTLYLHPFGSTDPRSDGKTYTRSHSTAFGAAVNLNEGDLNIQDLYVTKTCDVDPSTGLPNGGYCVGTGGLWKGTNLIKHCYAGYSGKHGFGFVANSAAGEDSTFDGLQSEQGSPYGSQTPYVSFNGTSVSNITHRYQNCVSLADRGAIGSTSGATGGETFYTHNSSGQDQFALMSFDGCNFNRGYIAGTNAVVSLTINNTIFGGDAQSGAKNKTLTRCLIQPNANNGGLPGQNRSDGTLVIRNCIVVPTGSGVLNNGTGSILGTVTVEGCTFDLSAVTAQGGTSPGLLSRAGATTLTFRNNAIVTTASITPQLFKGFVNTDSLTISNNVYLYSSGTVWASSYNDGTTTANRSFAQWQALGFDANSQSVSSLSVDASYRPQSGSALIHAGVNLGPLADYTGTVFTLRDTVGSYQFVHPLTAVERGDLRGVLRGVTH